MTIQTDQQAAQAEAAKLEQARQEELKVRRAEAWQTLFIFALFASLVLFFLTKVP